MSSLHAPDCTPCKDGLAAVKDAYEDGGHLDGGLYRVVEMKSLKADEPNVRVLAVTARHSRQVTCNADQREVGEVPAGDSHFKLYLRRSGDSWVVGWLEIL
jgi:hypothetical protein